MKIIRLLLVLLAAGGSVLAPAQASAMHMSNAGSTHPYSLSQRLDARMDINGNALLALNVGTQYTGSKLHLTPAVTRAAERQQILSMGATPILAGPDLGALRKAASGTGLDGFLLILVLIGLVAFQLRRTQDSLHRPFNNI